jgi:hypothetical protein
MVRGSVVRESWRVEGEGRRFDIVPLHITP